MPDRPTMCAVYGCLRVAFDTDTCFRQRILAVPDGMRRQVNESFSTRASQIALMLPPARRINYRLEHAWIDELIVMEHAAATLEVNHRRAGSADETHFVESILANEMQRSHCVAVPWAKVEQPVCPLGDFPAARLLRSRQAGRG